MNRIPLNYYRAYDGALNIADLDVVAGAAGPGRRLCLWLQGCLKHCRGCMNEDYRARKNRTRFAVARVIGILDSLPGLSGITLSGGEPVLQAQSLLPLLAAVRLRDLTVVCYSGYTLAELQSQSTDPVMPEFLSLLDLLIDGEYRPEFPRGGCYRPTANQELHFLSGRITAGSLTEAAETDFLFQGDSLVETGNLPADITRFLLDKLKAKGINIKQ